MSFTEETKAGPSTSPGYFVHIIESPNPRDLLDGRTEGRLLTEALSLAGIVAFYSMAADKDTFTLALHNRLGMALNITNGIPIVHFSAHGNESGISLTDGTFIQWDELRNLLLPINAALQGALVVCMSSCGGFSGCRMAMNEEGQLPFFGIIGHAGTPAWSDAAVAFVTFYHRFFRGASVPDAVRAMSVASGDDGFQQMTGHQARQTWVDYLAQKRREELQSALARLFPQQGNTKQGLWG